MSFTDGKQRIATEADCQASWSGSKSGLRFRCKMCGHRFEPGDKWRFIWANIANSPTISGNFAVCGNCDAENAVLLQRMAALEEEAVTRFWWLFDDDAQLEAADRRRKTSRAVTGTKGSDD